MLQCYMFAVDAGTIKGIIQNGDIQWLYLIIFEWICQEVLFRFQQSHEYFSSFPIVVCFIVKTKLPPSFQCSNCFFCFNIPQNVVRIMFSYIVFLKYKIVSLMRFTILCFFIWSVCVNSTTCERKSRIASVQTTQDINNPRGWG